MGSFMKILADENMPLLAEFFADIGEVTTLPGRHMGPADTADQDVLLVRSVTRVDRALVEGSQVRFVGTATIGRDHIDLPTMAELGIQVASAPGCNARAVGEYVATVLVSLAAEQGWQPEERVLGVVGLGNTGSQVVALARALGFRVIGCDPVVSLPDVESLPLDQLLAQADLLSLHVPLFKEGPHPTWHLLDEKRLSELRPNGILINCSRGEVVDNLALLKVLQARADLTAVLDVWEGEPRLMPDLLAKVRWGTPHIAGYSQEGKWRGTEAVYRALCQATGREATLSLQSLGLEAPLAVQEVPMGLGLMPTLAQVLQTACPLSRDDARLRASMREADPAAAFDALRRHYPPRREFTAHRLHLASSHPAYPLLAALGFGFS